MKLFEDGNIVGRLGAVATLAATIALVGKVAGVCLTGSCPADKAAASCCPEPHSKAPAKK